MSYRCEATSLKGFVQQIACVYVRHGYRWFVQGRIREGKDPRKIDASIVSKYGIAVSEATRWRRKQLGKANLQYLRFNRDFILIATGGEHRFKTVEARVIRDIQDGKSRILVGNYSISRRRGGRLRSGKPDPKWRSHVQIEWEHYKALKAMFVGLSCRRSETQLGQLFYELPFEPYAPIRRQIAAIWAEVNRRRKRQQLPPVPVEVLPFRTKSVKVFEPNRVKRIWSPTGRWWYEVRIAESGG